MNLKVMQKLFIVLTCWVLKVFKTPLVIAFMPVILVISNFNMFLIINKIMNSCFLLFQL